MHSNLMKIHHRLAYTCRQMITSFSHCQSEDESNEFYTTKLTAKNSHIAMITAFSHNLKVDRGHDCLFPSRIRFALRDRMKHLET